ncbi:MAG: HD domain-containing protein [Bacillota bacterium]|nr:HD domain-containing protein [Bacillota bacterium]
MISFTPFEETHDACLPREINLGQLLSAISLAFDFAERAQLNHARRVAYVSLSLGELLGLGEGTLRRVLLAALLHDIGATESFNELKDEELVPTGVVYQHPLRGAEMVAGLPQVSDLGPIIVQHHERWGGGGYPFGLSGEAIRLEARLLHLADRFELVYAAAGWEQGLARVERGRGGDFQPELVDAFFSLARIPKVQLDLEERNIGRVIGWEVDRLAQVVVTAELCRVAGVFAGLIDNRSPYTANHSQGVAQHAGVLGRRLGLESVASLQVAALLHDLGKIGVPSRILNKPGRLTPEEYQVVRVHPYYTEHILRQVKGLEDIVPWAAQHHEHLDGTGYHTAAKAGAIPLESRIVAVSDVYQALTSDRPYRPGLAVDDALGVMRQMAAAAHLDPEVVQQLAVVSS